MKTAILAFAAAGLLALPAEAAPTCSKTVAFTHATVLPMTGGAVLKDHTVLVVDGRVARMGPSKRVRPPRGACVVDARGKFLTPGLSDAHAHVFDEGDMALYLAHGVTSVLNMSGSHMHLRLREAVAAGRADGPTVYTTGPMLKTEATPLIEFEERVRAADAAAIVRSQKAAGYDFVKVWGSFPADVYATIAGTARAEGMPLTGHLPREIGLDEALEAGQLSLAHVEELTGRHFKGAPTAEQIAETAEVLKKAGATTTTTLVVYEAIAAGVATDVSPLMSRPGVEYMDPARKGMWSPGGNRFRNRQTIGKSQQYLDDLQTMKAVALGLHRAGVPLLAGVDAGELPGLAPGLDLHRELELLVEAGLTPAEALATATVNFGRYMARKGETFGVIAPGARADLLLVAADPRADVKALRRIEGVTAAGRYYDRRALDGMLDALKARNTRTEAYFRAVGRSPEAGAEFVAARLAEGVEPVALTPGLFMALGRAQQGDLTGAETVLRQVATAHPTRAEPWFVIAGLRRAAKDTVGAKAALEHALALAPAHERVRRDLAGLNVP